MIEINLLPSSLKKRINILAYIGEVLPYAVLAVLIILLFNLLLGALIAKRAVHLKTVEAQWKKQEPRFKDIKALKQTIANLNKSYEDIGKFSYSYVNFSQAMYLLYKSLPPNVWFRELNYQNDILEVKGAALDFEKDASVSLKEYLTQLQNEITSSFAFIDIKSQELRRVKDRNVLYFILELKNAVE